ncbi:Uncharacterized protein YpbB [Mesobacillus persicus]|uniref:Uncharacterized protein YpbB n=1 Tax=Mesobacillus persicus TaxID=930146 RepID=A0A1H8BU36_9BACI|nr:helix-turn-helix domain-containing protein [Mesobacillus persicus]SEM86109.1 Uncharacterized protein YpbB [Mesobacillus persicus]
MTISYSDAVLLHCLNQINNERSIYSLYHLFQGKKSSQTIQDAHLFNLTAFFRAFPLLTRMELEKAIEELQHSGLLERTSNEHYRLNKFGESALREFHTRNELPPKFLEGWNYHHLTTVFWERLSILVQVCSNLVHQKKGFIPVQNKQETLEWVKSYIKAQNINRYDLAEQLYNELIFCLESEQTIQPSVLILRMTGNNRIGLTSKQAADMLNMENTHYQLEFLNVIHFMIGTISANQDQYKQLSGLVRDAQKTVPFTLSTEKTYRLIEKGFTPIEIANIRKLKTSTIEDHIVEIALHLESFDLNKYVNENKQERIMKVANETSAKKLKQIRDYVNDASYFEIRLVLARNGGRQWN